MLFQAKCISYKNQGYISQKNARRDLKWNISECLGIGMINTNITYLENSRNKSREF